MVPEAVADFNAIFTDKMALVADFFGHPVGVKRSVQIRRYI